MKLRWETPRYLGSTGGYTTDPAYALGQTSAHPSAPENFIGGDEIRDCPEVAVPADIQKAFTDEARAAHETRGSAAQQAALQDERVQLGDALARREGIAQSKGVSVSSDVRVIQRRLEAIDKKLGY